MPFAYYAKLSAARQRIYRSSDAIDVLALPSGVAAGLQVVRIRDGLARDDRAAVRAASQYLIDALVAGYQVPKIRVRVLAQRPADDSGELHGLYEPDDAGTPARITVWMRTAARRDVVAFKTFLRTLVHELCHHLDYELFKLPETFHTEGFYKRESTLANALLQQEIAIGDPQGRLIRPAPPARRRAAPA
ncbi:MAG: hypothetical protein ABI724_16845 [Betaproteobacteria bacterium]